jgi:hypothetical protein
MEKPEEKLGRLLAEIRSKGNRVKDKSVQSSALTSILAILEDAAKGQGPNKGSD